MARRAAAPKISEPDPEPEELELEPNPPRVAQVTERTLKTRTYLEEERSPAELQPEEEIDPIETFLRSLDRTRNLSLHVEILPNFEVDGIASMRAPGRAYIKRMEFTPETIETYREVIQQRAGDLGYGPSWYVFTLREDGLPMKGGTWREKLAPLPPSPHPNSQPGYAPAPVIVNPPPLADPFSTLKPAFAFMKDALGFVKELAPAPPAPADNQPANQNGERPFGERLVEALAVKAIETGKTDSMGDILKLWGDNREPSVWETVFNSTFLTEGVKVIGPGLNSVLNVWAYKQQLEAKRLELETRKLEREFNSGAEAGPVPGAVGSPETGAAALPPQPETQPMTEDQMRLAQMTRRYQSSIVRLIEDCERLAGEDAAVQNISDLIQDFPELEPIIQSLADSPTAQVFEQCASILPNAQMQAHVRALGQMDAQLQWLLSVQRRLQEIIPEIQEQRRKDEEGTDGGNENED